MSRCVLSGAALAVVLSGCATLGEPVSEPSVVVGTEVVHIGCPTDPPLGPTYVLPEKPVDMRLCYDAYDLVPADFEGDRAPATSLHGSI